MGISKKNGTPKSSILIGFSIINHPFWGPGYPYFWKHPNLYISAKHPTSLGDSQVQLVSLRTRKVRARTEVQLGANRIAMMLEAMGNGEYDDLCVVIKAEKRFPT